MALENGKHLGPYVIDSPAGAGGMGEVYKAKDMRLDRTVAIKVLPEGVADIPDLRARFEREAKSISSLNHPNICTLYDVGHEDGIDFIVMEYIEGTTLSERLTEGPLPTPELLTIATQVADALDKAHRQGLVHRDLKPGNIMLTREGAKLLDFGLAKIQHPEGMPQAVSGITQTTPLTGEGTIVGTIQYMAPEQLEGHEADARSDIFAFGAVLYEMATGHAAFSGSGRASLIASIMKEVPKPISQVQPLAPPMLERVVSQCLEKDPDLRWQTAGDLKRSLQWIAEGGSQAGLPAALSTRRKARQRITLGIAIVSSIVALTLGTMAFLQPEPDKSVLRFVVEADSSLSAVSWPRISPDGKFLAFLASGDDGVQKVYVRPMNSLDAYPLAGTENASRPFWSPDSKYLAFVVGRGQLKKIAVGGGPAQLIGETDGGSDGTWGREGIILFDGGPGDSIQQIPASGGIPTAATTLDSTVGDNGHAWPWFLPDGKHFLYLASVSDTTSGNTGNILRIGSLDSFESKVLFPTDSRAEYCEPGYLIYMRGGILLAHPFDADKLETTGEPFPVADKIGTGNVQLAYFGVSDQGTIAIQHNVTADNNYLMWFDRTGKELGRVGKGGSYDDIDISPDGKKVAYAVRNAESDGSDIWVYDLDRDVPSRLTFEASDEGWPVWSPDGRYIYYVSDGTGRFQTMRRESSGLGVAELLTATPKGHVGPSSFSPDGKTLYGSYIEDQWDVITMSPDVNDSTVTPLIATKFSEQEARISPDGRFLAYAGRETGRYEVYVRDLQGSGGKWQISSTGAREPMWSPDGKELYFVTADWDFVAVPVNLSGSFQAGKPEVLFKRQLNTLGNGSRRWDLSPDGTKFLINTPVLSAGGAEFVISTNWYTEFKDRK